MVCVGCSIDFIFCLFGFWIDFMVFVGCLIDVMVVDWISSRSHGFWLDVGLISWFWVGCWIDFMVCVVFFLDLMVVCWILDRSRGF